MHNAAFQALGLDAVYMAFDVPEDRLGAAIAGARALGIQQLAVSIPHKQHVMQHLDEIDETARTIGAVNTITRRGERLVGDNTDWRGAMQALEREGDLAGKRAVVLGAGGTARAVTYGLLQIVGEFEIFRRERFGGLRIGAYVASKMAVLAPLLGFVNLAMLAILRGLNRLPSASATVWAELMSTSVLISAAAVALGLMASAAVQNPAQATLVLPMLCFPQVLFAGAVVPIAEMSGFGRIMSLWLADRWGFEALGRSLDMDVLVSTDQAAQGWVSTFSGSPYGAWIILSGITVAALLTAGFTLHRRSRLVIR
jgi:hypothetical protein